MSEIKRRKNTSNDNYYPYSLVKEQGSILYIQITDSVYKIIIDNIYIPTLFSNAYYTFSHTISQFEEAKQKHLCKF